MQALNSMQKLDTCEDSCEDELIAFRTRVFSVTIPILSNTVSQLFLSLFTDYRRVFRVPRIFEIVLLATKSNVSNYCRLRFIKRPVIIFSKETKIYEGRWQK